MKCNICQSESDRLFVKKVLNKYDVSYFKCNSCGFIQTEKAYWIKEAYENIITSLDIGLVYRNLYLSTVSQAILTKFFNDKSKFLDYGGGYGLFVRLMRDRGFDFYRQDKYCENTFAKNFDITDLPGETKFEVITTFEVFEHLEDPISEIQKILNYGDSILFSTELQSSTMRVSEWEYLAPETGQHIALYSFETLKRIAEIFNLNVYSNFNNIHLLTPKRLNQNIFRLLAKSKIASLYNVLYARQPSLLQQDYNFIKQKLNN
ncbi:class I SAM-dependent methyltransferase [Ohtaekwangia kribbensis]|jgi:hypothetical protein|uniref:Class I SAM-dependent methyltransferase n=1 Tax=Ohtaekwangia kribbensis TaxID=688913 RepID=A0ABW3K4W8_9BACT